MLIDRGAGRGVESGVKVNGLEVSGRPVSMDWHAKRDCGARHLREPKRRNYPWWGPRRRRNRHHAQQGEGKMKHNGELLDCIIATALIVDAPLLAVLTLMCFAAPPAWYWLLVVIACGWLVGYVYRFVRDECDVPEGDEHAKFGGRRD